jgi:hypothetical protein
MQRVDPAPWLAELQARIERGEFERGDGAPPDPIIQGALDRAEIGYAIGRRVGRGNAGEFWDAAAGRWNYDQVRHEDAGGWMVARRILPEDFTMYDEDAHARAMAKQVDETGTAYVFAVLPPHVDGPSTTDTTRRRR